MEDEDKKPADAQPMPPLEDHEEQKEGQTINHEPKILYY